MDALIIIILIMLICYSITKTTPPPPIIVIDTCSDINKYGTRSLISSQKANPLLLSPHTQEVHDFM